jgi:hypothetical protein
MTAFATVPSPTGMIVGQLSGFHNVFDEETPISYGL